MRPDVVGLIAKEIKVDLSWIHGGWFPDPWLQNGYCLDNLVMNRVTSGNASACRASISILKQWYGKPISIYHPRTSLTADSSAYQADGPRTIQNSASGLTVSSNQRAGAPWGGTYESSLEYEKPTRSARHVLPRLTACSTPRDNAPHSRRAICRYWGKKRYTRHDRPQPGHRLR